MADIVVGIPRVASAMENLSTEQIWPALKAVEGSYKRTLRAEFKMEDIEEIIADRREKIRIIIEEKKRKDKIQAEFAAKGLSQCPICKKWNVLRAYIEDGNQGDWCPDCKKSHQQEVTQVKMDKEQKNEVAEWLSSGKMAIFVGIGVALVLVLWKIYEALTAPRFYIPF